MLMSRVQAQPQITPVTTGAIIASQEPVLEIGGYTNMFVTLAEPENEPRWSTTLGRMRGIITSYPSVSHIANRFRPMLLERL